MTVRFERPVTYQEAVGRKSHFVVVPAHPAGFAVIIRRNGRKEEVIHCETAGEVNRQRLRLSSEGLIGYLECSL